MTINLLEETMAGLKSNNKNPEDVRYVILDDRRTSFENFCNVAKTIDYDNGYGCAYISRDLCIVGDTWWLSRTEYDGAEWFRYNEKPLMPVDMLVVGDLRAALLSSF